MKNIYFLCGLPRCGNTLLASILNQNPNISVTANSITADILYNLEQLKENTNFKNFPNHQSLDNLIEGSLELYFKDYESNYIIDRSPWGTPKNIELIKKYITPNPKFIILERPFIEILSSLARVKNWNKKDLEDSCFYEMTEGITATYAYAIHNIIKSDSDYIKINYEDLTINPEKNIKRIYEFLNISTYNHRYVNLDQFSINSIKYDDTVLDGMYHDVKEDKVEKNNYDLNMYLSESIINKYKNMSLEKWVNKFLDIPEQNHRYVNLNQLTINNVQYDDTVLGKTYHNVKEDKVEKNSYDINMYLTPKIIEKYKDLSLEKFGKAIINDEALF